MRLAIRPVFCVLLFSVIVNVCCAQPSLTVLQKKLDECKASLQLLRSEHLSHRSLPAISFYLFGMGDRRKIVYKDGALLDAISGDTLRQWKIKSNLIVPSEYCVYLQANDGKEVFLFENENGVYVKENGITKALSESSVHLPDFAGQRFAPVLKVLHHEVLMNIVGGKPVPNFFVYERPWFRDATLMAMVLKQTANLHLIKDWVMKIRDPFDRNNHGMAEADNLGEVLFLVSLVSDTSHPTVKAILDSAKKFIKHDANGDYLEGQTDYSPHPVFQTKWMKYGLKSLHLLDTFRIPKVYDSYSSLFWWDYKNEYVTGARFDTGSRRNYPYLVWAEDHFFGEKKGMVSDGIYPLSWEAFASDAHYPGMKRIDENLVGMKLSMPHTWHASEMFLLLAEE